MAEIPGELITEILPRLPVKSLLRFRCLSKSVCKLIDGVDFTNSYLITSSENMIHRKMIFQDKLSRFHVCDMYNNDTLEEEDNQLKPSPSSGDNSVYGYCNGLLLLYRNNLPALWNPSTRSYRDLPGCPASFRIHRIMCLGSGLGLGLGLGLGYDSGGDDYKAVFIVYTMSGVEVWIFGVRSSTWKKIPCELNVNGGFESEYSFGHFADGNLHWLLPLLVENNWQREIVALDVRKETFSLVPMPLHMVGDLKNMHVLQGCLCISFFSRARPSTPSGRADLYMRRKDGVGQFNWTQLYSIEEPIFLDTFRLGSAKVLGCLKSGHKILLDSGMENLILYDLVEKCFQKVTKKSPFWNRPILCVESLVSIY